MTNRPFLSGRSRNHQDDVGVLEQIRAEIGVKLGNPKSPAAEIIAEKIIDHAERGLRTQTALYLATLADFKSDRPNTR